MINFDLYFFNLINQFAGKWSALDIAGILLAQYAEYILLLVLVILLIRKYWDYSRIILEAMAAAALARFIIVEIIYYFWFRPRPFLYNNAHLLLPTYDPNQAAFPSGHATFYFAIATTLFLYNRKLGLWFYGVATLIVISRVFVGVHWPSDIIAGAFLGTGIAWLLHTFFLKKREKYEIT